MRSNTFGQFFCITTWGESHGKAIGVVIDGCPAGLPLSCDDINSELKKRRPGLSPYTSPRREQDEATIYSGVFEGKTTGSPISIIIPNHDVDSSTYHSTKDILRPGHAQFTYLKKYGIFDYRGGGRASARETACRVAAGAVANKILLLHGIHIISYVKEIGGISCPSIDPEDLSKAQQYIDKSPLFCPDEQVAEKMSQVILEVKENNDSVGGVIECVATKLPIGLGDPVYEKLEAKLAQAMLSLPATKGFEIGSGFQGAHMKGSFHNDLFVSDQKGNITTQTNFAGGVLGGISNGMPLVFRVAFKPTSSLTRKQSSINTQGQSCPFELPSHARHDPCVAIRAVPIVKAMAALTLVDVFLSKRLDKL